MSGALYNAALDLLERNAVPGRAERPYLLTQARSYSYDEVIDLAHAAGRAFKELGAVDGDRVGLALRDRPELVIAFWGAIRANLVPVLLPPGIAAVELSAILEQGAIRVLVFDASAAQSALAPRPQAPALIAVDEPGCATCLKWTELLRPGSALPAPTTREDDAALWVCSSGTTGAPKAVVHRQRGLRDVPAALARQIVALTSDDVVLSVSRMCFTYGLGNSVTSPAAVGASTLVLESPALPGLVAERLAAGRATVLYGVPVFYRGLCSDPDARLSSSLRLALCAGETLDRELLAACSQRFGHDVLDGLGTTETLTHVTANRAGEVVPGSCGRALDGFAVKVLDAHGEPVRDGQRGELWVSGPTLFAGYFGRDGLTAEALREGWVRTGDCVRLESGHLFHEGRFDDLIKLGGLWVLPLEIEQVLRRHPDVRDVAVVPRLDASGVPYLCAFIVSPRHDEACFDELRALAGAELSRHKLPREWVHTPSLPRTASGKLRRFLIDKSPV